MHIRAHQGGIVSYSVPFINEVNTYEGSHFKSVKLGAKTLRDAGCLVLTTYHSLFDVKFIQEHSKMIVDMRNMVKEASDKVYKL